MKANYGLYPLGSVYLQGNVEKFALPPLSHGHDHSIMRPYIQQWVEIRKLPTSQYNSTLQRQPDSRDTPKIQNETDIHLEITFPHV